MNKTDSPKKRRGEWLTIRQLAGVLGITPQGFRASYLAELSAEDVRRGSKGVAMTIYAPAAVSLFAERQVRTALREATVESVENGPLSPELEKLRRVKRKREELTYAREIDEIESRGVLWSQVEEAMRFVEQFARDQIKKYGDDVAEAWSEAIAEVEAVAARYEPPGVRSRTLHVQLVDSTALEIPLPLNTEAF